MLNDAYKRPAPAVGSPARPGKVTGSCGSVSFMTPSPATKEGHLLIGGAYSPIAAAASRRSICASSQLCR
jgi:hypothetical protein